MSRYLVTGAAGFIGSHLTEALLADGHEVIGVDAYTDYYARDLKERNLTTARDFETFAFVEADLSTAPIATLTSDVDGIFHLAAQPGVRQSWGDAFGVYLKDNVHVTQRLLEAAGSRARVVFASSSSVYGEAEVFPTSEEVGPKPVSPYGVTKLTCEHLARTYASAAGVVVVCLRYFSVYGPRQRPDMAFTKMISSLLSGEPFTLFGDGAQVRDFTYVGDVVAATRSAMIAPCPADVYNVGGGCPTSMREAISLCEQVTGRQLQLIARGEVIGDPARTGADTGRIRTDLGWQPRTALRDGLAAQAQSSAEVAFAV
jgi:nucleoside-diphosphate-sugar epimerase